MDNVNLSGRRLEPLQGAVFSINRLLELRKNVGVNKGTTIEKEKLSLKSEQS